MTTFFVTGGTLAATTACYVVRRADNDLLDGLLEGAGQRGAKSRIPSHSFQMSVSASAICDE